ncbi:MAG: hypothetical protein GX605_09360 [Chloroflexi bacterium]|nr:hypothetical protein [Chloroflexota bacterium]
MPDCPNCGTWNPDDKKKCWRCDAEMPPPPPPKPARRPVNWVWVAAALFLLFTLAQSCMALQGGQQAPAPSSSLPYLGDQIAWLSTTLPPALCAFGL